MEGIFRRGPKPKNEISREGDYNTVITLHHNSNKMSFFLGLLSHKYGPHLARNCFYLGKRWRDGTGDPTSCRPGGRYMFRLKDSGGLRRAGKRGWDAILPLWPILFGIFVAVLSGGCSSGPTTSSAFNLVNQQGSHPANFLSTHPGLVGSAASECRPCHGDALTGGIANTSCFTASCHHGTIQGWATPAVHGAAAKRAPGNAGFASCQICHGYDFSTRLGTFPQNCFDCHSVDAPHPSGWLPVNPYSHNDTDPANAPVCSLCHFGEPNAGNHPPVAPPPGSNPGCFNNTLCHSQAAVPHIVGPAMLDPAVGGANFHGLIAKEDLFYCQTCHGSVGTTQFDGGVASTSCSTAACHPSAKAHPIPWFQAPQPFPGYVASHQDSGNRDIACDICHKVDGAGAGADPAAPSCFDASYNGNTCHSGGPGGANHTVPNLSLAHTSVDNTSFTGNCSVCHAVTGTSPLSAATLCTTCHGEGLTGSITAKSPLTNLNCTSCHAKPPAGSAYPNIANTHPQHDALTGVANVCTACHTGLDSGSLNHYNRANARPGKDALRVPPGDVAFASTYNAKSGNASFSASAFTCAGVSCHGGVTAPRWDTGTINVNTNAGCLACHTLGTALGTPENNSPFSGTHRLHLEQIPSSPGGNALCTECHDMDNGSSGALNHFEFLNTQQMEGPARQTVTFPGLTGATYDSGLQNCTLTCHGKVHTDRPWAGGATHAVPYLDTAHTNVTSGTFASNCGGCHFETGGSTKDGPTCTVCHGEGLTGSITGKSPLTNLNCNSCHEKPPAGSTYPNIAGTHDGHNALAGVTGTCTACHTGLDSGTQAHYDRANAIPGKSALRVAPGDSAFAAVYNAKSGAASFNSTAFTCANVSCHGGQTAPHWRTGTIDVNTDAGCKQCHIFGTTQHNGYSSGDHKKHAVDKGHLCTECHDMTLATPGAQNHFTKLGTTTMEGPASDTFLNSTGSVVYTPATKNCTGTCHNKNHNNLTW